MVIDYSDCDPRFQPFATNCQTFANNREFTPAHVADLFTACWEDGDVKQAGRMIPEVYKTQVERAMLDIGNDKFWDGLNQRKFKKKDQEEIMKGYCGEDLEDKLKRQLVRECVRDGVVAPGGWEV